MAAPPAVNSIDGPAMSATILYLGTIADSPVQEMKLSGVRRYAVARYWEVVPVPKVEFPPEKAKLFLHHLQPIGCIVDCCGNKPAFAPSFFGRLPVVWLDIPSGARRLCPFVSVDDEAVARTALRELSANRPASFATVEFQWQPHQIPGKWSFARTRAFRKLVAASGHPCEIFKSRVGEASETRMARLADWLSRLPRPCGVFAVNDGTTLQVCTACRAAGLHVPRDISVVGVDNSVPGCEKHDPTFSSIQIDFERAGFLAARLLAAGKSPLADPTLTDEGGGTAVAIVGPLLCVRRQSTGGRGRHEPRILQAVEMIRREACAGLTAAALAARFRGSRRLFELRFREATGHSVLDEILYVRLERAFTLLAETDTAIGAVADLCGFRSHWALDFLFRSRFKMSMSEWRRRNGRMRS